MIRGKWIAGAALLLTACGVGGQGVRIDETRRAELRSVADKASRLSELSRQAYTRNTLLQFSAAEQDYRETLGLARDLFPTDPARASSLRLNLALNKSNLGQFEAAESLFRLARPIVREIGIPADRAKPDLFYAQHRMNQKQFASAAGLAEGAIVLLDGMIAEMRASGDAAGLDREALPRRPDGTVLIDQQRANQANARPSGEEDLDTRTVRIGEIERLQLQRVQSHYIIARALKAQGAGQAGIDARITAAERDLATVPPVFGRWLRAEIASLRADRLVAGGQTDAAIRELDTAIATLRLFEINSRPEALLLFKQGEILIGAGRGPEGQRAYRRAMEILRNDSQGLEIAQAQTLIEQLLGDVQAGDSEAASRLFELMQRVRSSATAQTLAQLSARLASGDSGRAQAIREVQNLEREVNILAAKVDRLEGDPNADLHYRRVTASKLAEARTRLGSERTALGEIAPNYDQLVDATIPLDAAQAALGDGETLVAIHLGADKGLVMVVTNLSFEAYETTLSLETAATEVTALRAAVDGEFLLAFDIERSHALYRALFSPVASKIAGAGHLIVVPTGPLMSLPFNTLVSAAHTDEIRIVDGAYFDYSKVAWLGRQTAITTGVSISSFFLGRKVPGSVADKPFLGFGDFRQFGRDEDVVTRIAQQRGLPDSCRTAVRTIGLLNELDGTRDELTKVQAALGLSDEDVVLGEGFTDSALKVLNLSAYRVLHFATHGLLAQDPECLPEPGLVTSLAPDGDTLLEASEIVNLALDAELVVMSACDTSAGAGFAGGARTGLGYTAGGESLSGLARSFFFAGARNVLSTLWSVDDAATQELMVGFYAAAAADDGIGIAEAMRRTQEKLIADGPLSHPFFWAPFATIGDGARRLGIAGASAALDRDA